MTTMATKSRGGKRPGAGRPEAGTVRLEVRPKKETAVKMRTLAEGITLGALLDKHFGTDRVIVYAGPHYGRVHYVLHDSPASPLAANHLYVQHRDGNPFWVPKCDTEAV